MRGPRYRLFGQAWLPWGSFTINFCIEFIEPQTRSETQIIYSLKSCINKFGNWEGHAPLAYTITHWQEMFKQYIIYKPFNSDSVIFRIFIDAVQLGYYQYQCHVKKTTYHVVDMCIVIFPPRRWLLFFPDLDWRESYGWNGVQVSQ